jgi:hypothetical protein
MAICYKRRSNPDEGVSTEHGYILAAGACPLNCVTEIAWKFIAG